MSDHDEMDGLSADDRAELGQLEAAERLRQLRGEAARRVWNEWMVGRGKAALAERRRAGRPADPGPEPVDESPEGRRARLLEVLGHSVSSDPGPEELLEVQAELAAAGEHSGYGTLATLYPYLTKHVVRRRLGR